MTGEDMAIDTAELDELVERYRKLQPTNRAAPKADERDWCRIVMRGKGGDEDVADVYIYDEIGFWGTSAADFADRLGGLDVDRINLHVNSPGGAVFDGIAIYNMLRNHSAHVDVTVDALAASAASFIAQAGDTITMGRQAMMMIHDASGFVIGNAGDMREMADLLDKLTENIAEIYADRSGYPVGHWRQAMAAETWYSAQEAVDGGLADELTAKDDDDEDAAAKAAAGFDLDQFRYGGRAEAPPPPGAPTPLPSGTPTPADGGDPDAERIRPAAQVDSTFNPSETRTISTSTTNLPVAGYPADEATVEIDGDPIEDEVVAPNPGDEAPVEPGEVAVGEDDPERAGEPVEPEGAVIVPDLGSVFRGAVHAAVAPFELSADSVRVQTKESFDNAPAVHVPKRPAPPVACDPVTEDAPAADVSPAAAPDDGAAVFRDAIHAVTAVDEPDRFELSADSFRVQTKARYDNAPAVYVPKPAEPAACDRVTEDAQPDADSSGTLPADGTIGFADRFRATVQHRAVNAPAVDVPGFPKTDPSDDTPLDYQRVILEEATR